MSEKKYWAEKSIHACICVGRPSIIIPRSSRSWPRHRSDNSLIPCIISFGYQYHYYLFVFIFIISRSWPRHRSDNSLIPCIISFGYQYHFYLFVFFFDIFWSWPRHCSDNSLIFLWLSIYHYHSFQVYPYYLLVLTALIFLVIQHIILLCFILLSLSWSVINLYHCYLNL